jgi:hypothetical protein
MFMKEVMIPGSRSAGTGKGRGLAALDDGGLLGRAGLRFAAAIADKEKVHRLALGCQSPK